MKYTLYSLALLAAIAAVVLYSCCKDSNIPMQTTMENDTTALVMVDDTTVNGLIVYYPQFTSIDLVCDTMPSQQDTNVVCVYPRTAR